MAANRGVATGYRMTESRLDLARLLLADFDPDVLTGVTGESAGTRILICFQESAGRSGRPAVPWRRACHIPPHMDLWPRRYIEARLPR